MSGLTGRECHRDSAEDSFGMQMRHLRRPNNLGDNCFRISGVEGAQRGDSHGRAVATGSLVVESGSGCLPPVHAVADATQCVDREEAVVTARIEPSRESGGKPILIDSTVIGEFGDYGAGHFGVIGPPPLPGSKISCPKIRYRPAHDGEFRTQRVSHGQPVE